jgi:hypothetical protein
MSRGTDGKVFVEDGWVEKLLGGEIFLEAPSFEEGVHCNCGVDNRFFSGIFYPRPK